MRHKIFNRRLLTILLILGGLLVIGGYYLFQPGRNRETANFRSQSLPKLRDQSVPPKLPTRIEADHSHHPSPVGTSVTGPSLIPADKIARLEALDNLPYAEAEKKEIEILTEGMDVLSAAKYLRALNGSYGIYHDAIREYVDRAVAEDPDSFEALLLWCQLRPPDQDAEREAGFRKLLKMNPNSVDALVGLGTVLYLNDRPEEALEYFQQATLLDPDLPYPIFGFTYERLGEYDKALAILKKSYKITRSPVELNHILAIEKGSPIFKPIKRSEQGEPPESSPSEGTLPEAPLHEDVPSPAPTKGLEHETELGEAPPEEEKRTLSPEARQAMEAEFEKLIAEYERMIRGESSPTDVGNQQISDLKRSIESSPNRSNSYLDLGRAYEKAGENKKAAEVYRQARKRFPKDKRFQRTQKDGSTTRGESESLRKRRGGARSD